MRYNIYLFICIFLSLLFNISCDKREEIKSYSAQVQTLDTKDLTDISVACRGKIINFGTGIISEQGIELNDGTGYRTQSAILSSNNEFSVNFNGLTPNKTYKYRTYVIDATKQIGAEQSFTTLKLGEDPDNGNLSTSNNPFVQNSEGYFAYRIPSMVVTNNGTILVFAEGRRNSIEDTGDIDIVLKRSIDNGATWSALEIIKDDGVNRCQNPVPIVIPGTNRIVLLTCWNLGTSGNRRVFVTYSEDEGRTWSDEKEITEDVKPSDWNWYAVGPCHGIVKIREPHRGRLMVPANHTLKGSGQSYSHVIYSDDQGATWQLGGTLCPDTNESTVAELSNGDLMLNMRRASDVQPYRVVSISKDGGSTWEECRYDYSLPSPGCQGSLLTYDFNGDMGKGRLLFSNPAHKSSRRKNTIRLSKDDGITWDEHLMYVENTSQTIFYSAYSDITKLPDGSVAIIYEKGYRNEEGIWFRKIKLSELE